MLSYLNNRLPDYNVDFFINELFETSKLFGILEAKIEDYKFSRILFPVLHKKEAISSMAIEGTQTTISDVLEHEISSQKKDTKEYIEVKNHTNALMSSLDYLKENVFTNNFFYNLHQRMMVNILPDSKKDCIGKYKTKNNYIVNSFGKIIFTPPDYKETAKYMNELINFMNNNQDNINPLIKAAIIHSQFESIHPFEDGNGRVGRLLITLYFYKAKIINSPFFYISEAISQDKAVYYSKLTSSREGNYNEWIKFFLQKCIVQAKNHICYIDSLNQLYEKTKLSVQKTINSANFDRIIECMFTYPILNSKLLSEKLGVTIIQARRYLDMLESKNLLLGDDRQRNRTYYFQELLDLARRS